MRAGLQGRLLGQSPSKSEHGTPTPLCPQLEAYGAGSLPQLPLGGASTLLGSWSLGSSAPSAQRPEAFPASCLASSPTCSSCPIASIFLSSGTTACVLVSRGALGVRTPSPCGHLLPVFLPLGASGPAPSPSALLPLFRRTQTSVFRPLPALRGEGSCLGPEILAAGLVPRLVLDTWANRELCPS